MKRFLITFIYLILAIGLNAQSFIMNPYGRDNTKLLNGKWNAIVDQYSRGEKKQFYLNQIATEDTKFLEYGFEGAMRLDVPGDFNSQYPELKYYEGDIWYQRYFEANKQNHKRSFIYFAGVSYEATVWLNGKKVGNHEGGFTPFQFEVTDLLKEGKNDIVVKVNNNRKKDRIPAMNFDWWNYGGILRDVFLVQTPDTFIRDYKIQLKKNEKKIISGYVQLDGAKLSQQVTVSIPELKIEKIVSTNNKGYASFEIKAKPKLWNPDSPKMYNVSIISEQKEQVKDEIGFRNISVNGDDILLNGEKVFLKGVNFHEEIPQRLGRAYSTADAAMIIEEVTALGCNFIRTAHYPQNEHIIRLAEKKGLMIWEEIPLWQGIDFKNPVVLDKAINMLREMIYRDKNRAGIIIWSVANETKPSNYRDKVLTDLINLAHELDDTRLVGAAFDNPRYDQETSTFNIKDDISKIVDVVGVNKYMGWYMPWPTDPSNIKWNVALDKPLIMTEFGCESLYGKIGDKDKAHSWSEDYQKDLYLKNLEMFKNIPNLSGTSPWVLFDFRSPYRCHPKNQEGWNRKGLISDKGQRKKAWFVMKNYYNNIDMK
ncbi:beta galactosidase jelly roll domain-containing protein [Polaribacter sp. Z014]|uniref:glycoside hydrolase family 2 protein n=1 Tax=Polaribacter sp. Z014 TaxID=2927126 RepID=UPI002022032F|nr:glycoside hydrolase family 2 TIM barrel-domain containing protein [Polaribacter sp. Z014]MCL7764150.1 beta galactosidase jelly roll domain-containing protein [Polaribacter sp. Z014]